MSLVVAIASIGLLGAVPVQTAKDSGSTGFTFQGKKFIHRFTKGTLREFTPKGQENLKTFMDMVTINAYPDVKNGDALASKANAVLEVYKTNKAHVVRTDSIPRTETKPAEHLIVVVFGRPEFIEASFARFALNNGVGASIVFSHRIYGKKVGDAMGKWLEKNGQAVENELMRMPIPK